MFAGLCHYDSFGQLVTVWQAGGGVTRCVCDNLANSLLCLPNFSIYHSDGSQRSDLQKDHQCVLLHLHVFRRHISFSVTQIRLQVTIAFVHFKEGKCCQLPMQVWLQQNEIRCLFCHINIKSI